MKGRKVLVHRSHSSSSSSSCISGNIRDALQAGVDGKKKKHRPVDSDDDDDMLIDTGIRKQVKKTTEVVCLLNDKSPALTDTNSNNEINKNFLSAFNIHTSSTAAAAAITTTNTVTSIGLSDDEKITALRMQIGEINAKEAECRAKREKLTKEVKKLQKRKFLQSTTATAATAATSLANCDKNTLEYALSIVFPHVTSVMIDDICQLQLKHTHVDCPLWNLSKQYNGFECASSSSRVSVDKHACFIDKEYSQVIQLCEDDKDDGENNGDNSLNIVAAATGDADSIKVDSQDGTIDNAIQSFLWDVLYRDTPDISMSTASPTQWHEEANTLGYNIYLDELINAYIDADTNAPSLMDCGNCTQSSNSNSCSDANSSNAVCQSFLNCKYFTKKVHVIMDNLRTTSDIPASRIYQLFARIMLRNLSDHLLKLQECVQQQQQHIRHATAVGSIATDDGMDITTHSIVLDDDMNNASSIYDDGILHYEPTYAHNDYEDSNVLVNTDSVVCIDNTIENSCDVKIDGKQACQRAPLLTISMDLTSSSISSYCINSSADCVSDTDDDPMDTENEPMFDAMTDVRLERIFDRYGLRKCSRHKMVQILAAMWRRMHRSNNENSSNNSSDSYSQDYIDSTGIKNGGATATTTTTTTIATTTSISNTSQIIFDFIRCQSKLMEQILTYTPIDIELLHQQLSVETDVVITKLKLQELLDSHSVFTKLGKHTASSSSSNTNSKKRK